MAEIIDKYKNRFKKLNNKFNNVYEFHLKFCREYQSCWLNGADLWYFTNEEIKEYFDEIYDDNKPKYFNVWLTSNNLNEENSVTGNNHFIHFKDKNDKTIVMLDPLYNQDESKFKFMDKLLISDIY